MYKEDLLLLPTITLPFLFNALLYNKWGERRGGGSLSSVSVAPFSPRFFFFFLHMLLVTLSPLPTSNCTDDLVFSPFSYFLPPLLSPFLFIFFPLILIITEHMSFSFPTFGQMIRLFSSLIFFFPNSCIRRRRFPGPFACLYCRFYRFIAITHFKCTSRLNGS
jgi:hypothetical protein